MVRAFGAPNHTVNLSVCDKLRWAVVVDEKEETLAFLPCPIDAAVERAICQHRRDRKLLKEKKPAKWEEKLKEVNCRKMNLVFNKRSKTMATSKQCKNGGKHLEELMINMELQNADDLGSNGRYFISSPSYPKKRLCFVSATDTSTGMDLLKDAYPAGQHADFGSVGTTSSHTHTRIYHLKFNTYLLLNQPTKKEFTAVVVFDLVKLKFCSA